MNDSVNGPSEVSRKANPSLFRKLFRSRNEVATPSGDTPLLYCRPDLAYSHIARMAYLFLCGLGSSEERYDIVHDILHESGVAPLPNHECNRSHMDEYYERVAAFTDCFYSRLLVDRGVHFVVARVLGDVLKSCTAAASAHLGAREMQEYIGCIVACRPEQAQNYELCASRRAHVASCFKCQSSADVSSR
jgi:hypothetical protein